MDEKDFGLNSVIGECKVKGYTKWITDLVSLADEQGNPIPGVGLLTIDTVSVAVLKNGTSIYGRPEFVKIDNAYRINLYHTSDFKNILCLKPFNEEAMINESMPE